MARQVFTGWLLACAALSLAGSAFPIRSAMAATPWPAQAEGRRLPRPAWILVVPARRFPDGSLSIWDRNDPWTAAWRVPRDVDGLRVVTLFGDSEDRRSITAKAIDGMMVDSLEVVRRKYGAPAVALAVSDGGEVQVAGWVRGYSASWESVQGDGDPTRVRERALATLSAMLGSRDHKASEEATDEPAAARPAEAEAVPKAAGDVPMATATGGAAAGAPPGAPTVRLGPGVPNEDGGVDYALTISSAGDPFEAVSDLRRLGPDATVTVTDSEGSDVKVVVSAAIDRAVLASRLGRIGFAVR